MKILVGCESSGTVRRAFAALGHDVWSVGLEPAQDKTNRHILGDVRDYLRESWDMLAVFHPPCTRLCNSGVRWLSDPPKRLSATTYPAAIVEAYKGWTRQQRLDFMWMELDKGADLFSACWNAPIERVVCENPVMHKYGKARIANYEPPAQIVQPHWFGHKEFKATGLYLRGLKPLKPTNKLKTPKPGTKEHAAWSRVHRASPGPNRWRERSKFFSGIADAMALQWVGEAA